MKYFQKLLIFIVLIPSMVFTTISVNATTLYQDIKTEVQAYITSGTLPSWHNNLAGDTGYQTIYTKRVRTSNSLDYFKTIPESELRVIITWYHSNNDTIWADVLANLDIEPKYLEQNKILGMYWDSRIDETYSYMYLIWTSEYLPSEFMNIKEMVVNNKTYKLYDKKSDKNELNSNWWNSDYYHYPQYNLTLHKTPIGGYEKGELLVYH